MRTIYATGAVLLGFWAKHETLSPPVEFEEGEHDESDRLDHIQLIGEPTVPPMTPSQCSCFAYKWGIYDSMGL